MRKKCLWRTASSCAALCNSSKAKVETFNPNESRLMFLLVFAFHYGLGELWRLSLLPESLFLGNEVWWPWKAFFLPLVLCPQFLALLLSALNGTDVPFCCVVPNVSAFNLSAWYYPCPFGLVSSVHLLNLLQIKEGCRGKLGKCNHQNWKWGHRVNYSVLVRKSQEAFNDHKQSGQQFQISSSKQQPQKHSTMSCCAEELICLWLKGRKAL